MQAEQITEPVAHHGEGPVWDEQTGRLLWVDLLHGDVLSLDPADGTTDRRHVGRVAGCVVPRAIGGLVVAVERGFAFVDDHETMIQVLPDLWEDPSVRMNDGACDPQGRFLAGSMAYDSSPGQGTLFCLDVDLSTHVVRTGVTISNGLGWSPDGATAYHVDSPTRRIDAFTYDGTSGAFGEQHLHAQLTDGPGMPDGLTVDSEGGVWVALWDGGAVHRYTAKGELDAVVELPVTRPTSCAFGGPRLDVLYVTTSALDLAEPSSSAGALFAVEPGVTGLPTTRFAG